VRDRVKRKQVKNKNKIDYSIKYSFKPNGSSKSFYGEQRVKKSIWKQVQKGEPIEVQYIKDSPKSNRLTLGEF
jgi:hypothetical protein